MSVTTPSLDGDGPLRDKEGSGIRKRKGGGGGQENRGFEGIFNAHSLSKKTRNCKRPPSVYTRRKERGEGGRKPPPLPQKAKLASPCEKNPPKKKKHYLTLNMPWPSAVR